MAKICVLKKKQKNYITLSDVHRAMLHKTGLTNISIFLFLLFKYLYIAFNDFLQKKNKIWQICDYFSDII